MSLWPTFYYDSTSKSFLRHAIKPSQNRNKHDVAGSLSKSNGYYIVSYKNVPRYCHRIIWELFNPKLADGEVIDHIDGNKLNNSIENLRVTTDTGNGQNVKKSIANNTGITGVCKWNSTIYVYYRAFWINSNGKQFNKLFSIQKLGESEAFRLACEYRELMINQLNNQGAQYTERHGK